MASWGHRGERIHPKPPRRQRDATRRDGARRTLRVRYVNPANQATPGLPPVTLSSRSRAGKQWPDLQFITFGRRPSTAHWRRCQIGAAADRRARHRERSHEREKREQSELCKKKREATRVPTGGKNNRARQVGKQSRVCVPHEWCATNSDVGRKIANRDSRSCFRRGVACQWSKHVKHDKRPDKSSGWNVSIRDRWNYSFMQIDFLVRIQ